ncbi:MAG: hypothetical protein WAL29_13140 [Bacteroidales bacterium]
MNKTKSLIILAILLLLFVVASAGCSTSRKNMGELRGLMLQKNLQLSRNKAFYSRHNEKLKRDAFRKSAKNKRNRYKIKS